MQSDDSRLLLEEMQQLEAALQSSQLENQSAQRVILNLQEKLNRMNAEITKLEVALDMSREKSHGMSSDRITSQKWQDRAEEAERRAEEAQRRAEKAEREIFKMRNPNFKKLMETMQTACAEELNQVWPRLIETMRVAVAEEMGQNMNTDNSEGEEIDCRAQQSDQASEGEDLATPTGSKNFPLSFQRHRRASYQGLESGNSQASLPPATRVQLSWEDYEMSLGLRPKSFTLPEDVSEHESHLPLQRQRRAGYLGLESSSTGPDTMRDDQSPPRRGLIASAVADDQGQQSDQANEGEEIGYQDQQSDQASQGQESYYMGQRHDQASEGENELHSFKTETVVNLEDDSQYESSPIRVSIPGNPQKPSIEGLKGYRSPALSPPPSSPSQQQQSQSTLPLVDETTSPSDQPSANDTGNRPDIKSSLDNLGDMERALPALSGDSKQKEQDFPHLPKGSPQIPGIPTVSTAPPIPKKPTVIPRMESSTWDRVGAVDIKKIDGSYGIDASFFAAWPDLEESDTGDKAEEQKHKTEMSGKKSVAAGKQPERPSPAKGASPATEGDPLKPRVTDSVAAGKQPEQPSPAKEASPATGGDPPKSIGTKSYAGTVQDPPPKVQAPPPKVQETAQSSRIVLKPGNAAAKAAAPQTDAPPADEAGFQTVQPRKSRGPSDRGGGILGQGEARSNKGGYPQGKFGQFQHQSRGGQGGNQKGGDRKGGNQDASQGQART